MSGRTCQQCGQPSKLQCPVCLKNTTLASSSASYFCSQDCFKKAWSTHKVLHVMTEEDEKKKAEIAANALKLAQEGKYNPWPGYHYTGSLRPWPYGPKNTVPAHIPKPDYAATGIPLSEVRARGNTRVEVMDQEDIKKIRAVGRIGREVLDLGAQAIKAGVTTDEIDRIIHEAIISHDAYPSPLNYNHFPRSCCTSVNEVICHGIPDLRPLQEGDILNIDVSVYLDGFHTDLNETYFVGEVDEASKNLVYTARECLERAIDIVKPGVPYREVGDVIQQHATEHGLSVVRSYCGHGVNRLFHCTPNIPHYAKNKAVGAMRPGHTFTIEPMISQGSWQDATWPDDWTSVTIDGKRSAQFEHTMVVTETGCEIVTASNQFADSTFSSPYPPAYAHLRPSTTSNRRPAPASAAGSA